MDIKNMDIVLNDLKKVGLNNNYINSGILATIGKESNFKPQSEITYKNTPNSSLRALFSDRLSKYSDDELTALKQNDEDFFDVIYGGVYGNDKKGDGYKYRGRGFNQITFKKAYERYGKLIGVDLVSNPDKLNEVDIASKVSAQFFKVRLTGEQPEMKKRFGVTDIQKLDDLKKAVQIAVNANAGWGKDKRGSDTEKKAFDYLGKIKDYLNENMKYNINDYLKKYKITWMTK